MGYGGWDAQPSKDRLPPRQSFRRAVRKACRIAVERGIMPASGFFPETDSPQGAALQQLMTETLLELTAR